MVFRLNVPVKLETVERPVNINNDVLVMPQKGSKGHFPLLIESKSAGDFYEC